MVGAEDRLNQNDGILNKGLRFPDCPARGPMQYEIICRRAAQEVVDGTAKESIHDARERLGFLSKAFGPNGSLSERQQGMTEWKLICFGSVFLPLVFSN